VQNTIRLALLVTSVGLCSACAQQAAQLRDVASVRDGASGQDVITTSELAIAGDSRTVLAALQRVRPSFLGTRGRVPAVSIDENLVTDISILQTLSVLDVCEIRLQRATSGAGHSVILTSGVVSNGDVLLVRTRQGTAPCRPNL
jgi:hypothetical protein